VGWIVALWCRMLVFGSGIAAFFRFPKSIREVKKWTAAFRGRGDVLPFGFFLHAFFAIGVSLFLSFFVFQAMVRFFSKKQRMESRALQTAREMTAGDEWTGEGSIAGQIKSVLELVRPS